MSSERGTSRFTPITHHFPRAAPTGANLSCYPHVDPDLDLDVDLDLDIFAADTFS
jgi:hypothetical protein